jgi:hypothetical protein
VLCTRIKVALNIKAYKGQCHCQMVLSYGVPVLYCVLVEFLFLQAYLCRCSGDGLCSLANVEILGFVLTTAEMSLKSKFGIINLETALTT